MSRAVADAYWTPGALARAVLGAIWAVEPPTVGEVVADLHRGGGAWVEAARGLLGPEHYPPPWGEDLSTGHDAFSWRVSGPLLLGAAAEARHRPDWVVGNPPYLDVHAHVDAARRLSSRHVVYLLRSSALEPVRARQHWLAGGEGLRAVYHVWPRPQWEGPGARQQTDSAHPVVCWWDATWAGPPTVHRLLWPR